MLDLNRKIAVVHPPRCGGTSIEVSLTGYDWFDKDRLLKHLNYDQTKHHLCQLGLNPEEFTWIGLKRHPVKRLESMVSSNYWSRGRKSGLLSLNTGEKLATIQPAPHENKNLTIRDYLIDLNLYQQVLDVADIDGFLQSTANSSSFSKRSEVTPNKVSFNIREINQCEFQFSTDFHFLNLEKSRHFGLPSGLIGALDFARNWFMGYTKIWVYHFVRAFLDWLQKIT